MFLEVEIGLLLHKVMQSWNMILGGHGKVMENCLGTEKVKCNIADKVSRYLTSNFRTTSLDVTEAQALLLYINSIY